MPSCLKIIEYLQECAKYATSPSGLSMISPPMLMFMEIVFHLVWFMAICLIGTDIFALLQLPGKAMSALVHHTNGFVLKKSPTKLAPPVLLTSPSARV